ncbi:hypothetical protein BT93_L4136 [Corymbia citriodora subsp. variegata]|uniref:Uncharacterized protein n=1 Tax=Corymbia citriodora subsp. variegata TaxID=360336 RepID=A0A8T0CUM8_CORYI|nr:hypothetical protein BT93_L4136 [Corymbia citriodora subsp. variegata]
MGRLEVGVLDLGFMREVEEILGDAKPRAVKAKRDIGVIHDEAPMILKAKGDIYNLDSSAKSIMKNCTHARNIIISHQIVTLLK